MSERVHPSKREIAEAFKELLVEKAYTDITVTDVVKRAKVARASFYRNFSSTNDVMEYIKDSIYSDLKENVLPLVMSEDERKWRSFLFRYIYFVEDNYQRFKEKKSVNASLILYSILEVAGSVAKTMTFSDIKEKYSTTARIGAVNSVILHWFDDGNKETPEEIVDYLMSFILDIK
ncbi:MAG: TetR/AcrR family transcriptional regulator [Lachnospiraceae bacterium]|nr:TetR/AcrR family transcriptional regulator [Lachnospiraceae bacterium]